MNAGAHGGEHTLWAMCLDLDWRDRLHLYGIVATWLLVLLIGLLLNDVATDVAHALSPDNTGWRVAFRLFLVFLLFFVVVLINAARFRLPLNPWSKFLTLVQHLSDSAGLDTGPSSAAAPVNGKYAAPLLRPAAPSRSHQQPLLRPSTQNRFAAAARPTPPVPLPPLPPSQPQQQQQQAQQPVHDYRAMTVEANNTTSETQQQPAGFLFSLE